MFHQVDGYLFQISGTYGPAHAVADNATQQSQIVLRQKMVRGAEIIPVGHPNIKVVIRGGLAESMAGGRQRRRPLSALRINGRIVRV